MSVNAMRINLYKTLMVCSLVSLISACALTPPQPTKTWSSTNQSLTADDWFKANESCQYDANKFSTVTQPVEDHGTVTATSITDEARLKDLYMQCMSTKGWYLEDKTEFEKRQKAESVVDDEVRTLLAQKKYPEAISRCRSWINTNPGNAIAYYLQGVAYEETKQYDMAILSYTDVIKNTPSDKSLEVDSYMRRGLALAETGKYADAIDDANKASYIFPGWSLDRRGRIFFLAGDYAKALNDFNQAIAQCNGNYGDGSIFVARGRTFAKLGKKTEAYKDFKRACDAGNQEGCGAVKKK